MAPSHAFAERAAARPARSSAQTVQRCPGRNGSDHACGCHAPASVQTVLSDGGSPLPPSVREQFEQHLGLDLSGVRVHDSQQAVTAARSVDARAFTVGNHIVFDAGEYRPSSSDGRRVLAHELVHVAQQSGAPEAAELLVGPANDSLELEADRLAGQPGAPTGRASAQQVSRIPGWRAIKEAAYSALIAGLRAARRTGISGLRALVGRLPAALQGFANAEIDIVDVVADILIGLVLAVVGIVVGFGEGIAGLVLGLIRLVGGALGGLYAAAADILTGSSHRTAEWWASFIQTIRAIPAGLRALVTNWLTEFQRASPERAGLMIGELTGQILAIIATFAVAASRAGTVGTVAAEGEAAVSTAARGAPALTLIEGGGQSAATAAGPTAVARGSAALQLAPDVAAAARPALRLVPPPAPAAVAVAAPVTAPVAAAGTGAQAAQVAAVAAGQATRAAQAAREERDRQRADRCQRRFPHATPIRCHCRCGPTEQARSSPRPIPGRVTLVSTFPRRRCS